MAESEARSISDSVKELARRMPLRDGNYPYACARVKAKKSLLYSPETYQRFLGMAVPQIARVLGEGEYRDEILSLGARYEGFDLVAMATRDNLVRVYNQILEFSEGELRDIVSLFVGRWDVWNLQTILRGKHYGAQLPELMGELIPAGNCTLEYLRSLAGLDTIDEVIEALDGSIYQETLRGVIEEHHELKSIAPLEDALYHKYYGVLLGSIAPTNGPGALLLHYIRMEIDIQNVRTLLRLSLSDPGPAEGYFIEGGAEFGVQGLDRMARAGWDAAVAGLKESSLYPAIGTELARARERGLNDTLRALDRHSLRCSAKNANLNPLSVLPVLDYMLAKKNEVDNIRIIVRGKEYGLGNDVIRSLLIVG